MGDVAAAASTDERTWSCASNFCGYLRNASSAVIKALMPDMMLIVILRHHPEEQPAGAARPRNYRWVSPLPGVPKVRSQLDSVREQSNIEVNQATLVTGAFDSTLGIPGNPF